jgi:hypothetical protein
MALTLALADAALKEDYLEPAREQLNNAHLILSQVESNTKDVVGRRAVLSLHVGRNSGVGARAERGTLPTAGSQKYAEERVPVRYNYGQIEVDGPVIKAMRNDEGAFVRAISSEMSGVTEDLKVDVNRQIFGASNGVIAGVQASGGASTTVTLDAGTPQSAIRQLEVGMVIDIGDSATFSDTATSLTIVTNPGDGTITVDSAVDCQGTDSIVRHGSGGATTNQKELTGLQSIVAASGTLFNVDPSTVPVWKSTVLSNSGTARPFNDNLAAQAMNAVRIASGEDANLLVTSDGVVRSYAAQQQAARRFNDTLDLKGGFKALSVSAGTSTVALTWDKDCPDTFAFLLNTKHLTQHVMSDWEWMDDDGAVLRKVSNIDAYEATLFKYHEVTTDKRNSHALIKDLQTA